MGKGAVWTAADRGVRSRTHFALGSAPRSSSQLQSFSLSNDRLHNYVVNK